MKHFLRELAIAAATCFLVLDSSAQRRDIGFSTGTMIPLQLSRESDWVFSLDYGQFFYSGLGFRTGFQWQISRAGLDNAFGVPLALAYRTHARSTAERLSSGAIGATRTGIGHGNVLGAFLFNLFNDAEFIVGLTPGFISDDSTHMRRWTQEGHWYEQWADRKSPFFLTVDAGITLNYNIWRFDIKLMPAFHYDLFGTIVQHQNIGKDSTLEKSKTMPVQWYFSLRGGFSFRF